MMGGTGFPGQNGRNPKQGMDRRPGVSVNPDVPRAISHNLESTHLPYEQWK